MIFEINDAGTTISTTTGPPIRTTKKHSLISRRVFIQKHSSISRRVLRRPSSSRSRSPSPVPPSEFLNKHRPLLSKNNHSSSTSSISYRDGLAEFAGGTTADCAAICCCCPCGLVNLLYFTVYKVPAGLCRRAFRRKRKQKLIKKGILKPKQCRCGCDETEIQIRPASGIFDCSNAEMTMMVKFDDEEESDEEEEEDNDEDGEEEEEEGDAMIKLEKEMWESFSNTGFWRSNSQREAACIVIKEV